MGTNGNKPNDGMIPHKIPEETMNITPQSNPGDSM
jgi:hypothetical protein